MKDVIGERYSLAEVVNSLKSTAAHKINKALKVRGIVWQEEYFDHVVRSSESLNQKSAYIWENPVRKGLVATPELYRWSFLKSS